MTITDFINLTKRYLLSIAAILLASLALSVGAANLVSGGATYTATAIAHMEVSAAQDYDSNNPFNHVTRSQLAYQKMRNYEALYNGDDTLRTVINQNNLNLTPEKLRETITLTTDPDRLLETVEVTLANKQEAVVIANSIIDTVATQIAEIEGEGTFVVTNISPATEESATLNALSSKKIVVLGLMLGLILAFTQALYRYLSDNRVRTVADIQSCATTPVLAVLPAAEDRTQAVRHIRSSLVNAALTTGPVVISALSDTAQSSRIAIELAESFQASSHRVILVDANPDGAITAKFSMTGKSGFTDLSRTNPSLEHVATDKNATMTLTVIPLGTTPALAPDTLAATAIQQVLCEAAQDYVVIIDSGIIPSPLNDSVLLLVAAFNSTTTNQVALADRRVLFTHIEHGAFLLDDANFSKMSVFKYGNPANTLPLLEVETA